MMKNRFLLLLGLLLLVTLACNGLIPLPDQADSVPNAATSVPQKDGLPATEDEVPRVSVEEAKAAFDNGTAVIVDVRSREAFETEHINGALFVTLGDFENDIANVPLEKKWWIITYCT